MRGFSHFPCSSDRSTGKVRALSHSSIPVQWYYDSGNRAIFRAVLPDGWAGDTARVTVTTLGTVLVDEEVGVSGGVISWDLDAKALNHVASNFDYGKYSSARLADTITVTFFAEGTLAVQRAQAAGTIVPHAARAPVAPVTSAK